MRSKRGSRVALVGAFLAVLLVVRAAQAAVPPKVALVKSSSLGPFEQATAAFAGALRLSALQPELLTFDLEGAPEKAAAILLQIRGADPALIVTVGSLATGVVLNEEWKVPVVFSMVLYPAQSGFVSKEGQAVTGVSLDVPLDLQFQTLRRLLPEARRLGVLYHPAETGGVIEAARTVVPRYGFTLDARPVADPGSAVPTLTTLLETAEVVWAVADGHVFTSQTTAPLILEALRRRVPLIGLSTAQVRTGALAALSCDYSDIGTQTAEVVLRLLGGENVAQIPVTVPRKIALALNLRSAQHLGLSIAPALQAEANEVIR